MLEKHLICDSSTWNVFIKNVLNKNSVNNAFNSNFSIFLKCYKYEKRFIK